ncbi:MAG: hypothetical protein MRY83_19075 [Flavobacteriales bacterium]|nr:hypothetical protein [Flavobacteriales bacterium]
MYVTENESVVNLDTCNISSLSDDGNDFTNLPTVHTGTLLWQNCDYKESKTSSNPTYANNAAIRVIIFDKPNDGLNFNSQTYYKIGTELSVGKHEQGFASSFGSGSAHNRLVKFFTNTTGTVGTWNDVSSNHLLKVGNSGSIFATASVDSCFFIGSNAPYYGLSVDIETGTVTGSGKIIHEYWNGSNWIESATMSCLDKPPYTKYQKNIFSRTQLENIRWDVFSDWARSTENSQSRFWTRFRIVSGALDTIPVIKQIFVHPSYTKMGEDGFVQHFGQSLPTRQLLVHQKLADDLSGASPGNVAINFSSNITLTPIDNNFQSSSEDGFGQIVEIKDLIDTSRNLTYTVGWLPSNNATGNVILYFRIVLFNEGDIIAGSLSEIELQKTVSISGQQDELQITDFSFKIPEARENQYAAISLLRDGPDAADTYTGNMEVVFTKLEGKAWKN